MVSSSALVRGAGLRRNKGPCLNLSDVPEIMPGAKCSATPAQREEFEDRCRKLYQDGNYAGFGFERVVCSDAATCATTHLQAMFPAVDEAVVRMVIAEAESMNHAIEALFGISSTTAAQESDISRPPPNLGVDDHGQFPCLTDQYGWQVMPAGQEFVRDDHASPKNSWRDLAHAAKDCPAPAALHASRADAPRKARHRPSHGKAVVAEQPILSDHEARHLDGQRRVQLKAKHGGKRSLQKHAATLSLTVRNEEDADEDGLGASA